MPADWNLDQDVNDEGISRDINFIGIQSLGIDTICDQPPSDDETLVGHNDWDNLIFEFPPPGPRSGSPSGADLIPEISSELVKMIKDEATQGNTPPVLSSVGDKTVTELSELSFVVSATDLDVPEQEILYSVFNKPLGVVMDMNTGEFTWVPTEEQGLGVYTFDISATDGITNSIETINVTVLNSADSSPRDQKEDLVGELEYKKDYAESKKTKKQLEKAIKSIEKSLDDSLWIDDSHLSIDNGKKVFKEEKKAVKELQKIVKKDKESSGFITHISNIILSLVDVDAQLATVALDEAQAFSRDEKADKQITKAEKEMNKAQKDLDKGKFDKAIQHYKKAWMHAQKAMNESIPDTDDDDDDDD